METFSLASSEVGAGQLDVLSLYDLPGTACVRQCYVCCPLWGIPFYGIKPRILCAEFKLDWSAAHSAHPVSFHTPFVTEKCTLRCSCSGPMIPHLWSEFRQFVLARKYTSSTCTVNLVLVPVLPSPPGPHWYASQAALNTVSTSPKPRVPFPPCLLWGTKG